MIEIIPNWHPLFVHFAIALLCASTLFFALAALNIFSTQREAWIQVGQWNLWLGIAFGVITVLAGVLAYNSVNHDGPSHVAMTDHRNWALVTIVVFIVLGA